MGKRPGGKRPLLFRLGVTLLVLAIGLVLLDMKLRPQLRELARLEAQQHTGALVSRTVAEVLSRETGPLVQVQRRPDGGVQSVETDIAAANRLKSSLELALAAAFSDQQQTGFRIPLANLLGISLFSGPEPCFSFALTLAAAPQVQWESSLEEAGVNQTVHRVRLLVEVQACGVMPGVQAAVSCSTRYLAAETVIVGQVPYVFAGN